MLQQCEEHDADRFRPVVNATFGGGRDMPTRLDVFIINIGATLFVLAGSAEGLPLIP